MSDQRFVLGTIPERFIEVDAARLLLIVVQFACEVDDRVRALRCLPDHEISGYLTPEYYLQKLDFLLRYPSYFVYELTELYRMGMISEQHREELIQVARTIVRDAEPELKTRPFRRFWRGAYERLDDVEAWWYARRLIYTGLEPRGNGRPTKNYFPTPLALSEAQRLIAEVSHACWYAQRITLIHRFFGALTAADLKRLQYSHPEYREAQLNEVIPDLDPEEVETSFQRIFGEALKH